MFEDSEPHVGEDSMVQFPIFYERDKGPQTPNFRKLSKLLHSDTPAKRAINRENIMLKHGAVGIKMKFVCDILEKLEQTAGELRMWRDGKVVYTKKKESYDFIFNLDIYIFELYSVLDYFALEVGEILDLKKKKRGKRIDIEYFTDLKDASGYDQNTLVIKEKSEGLNDEQWYKYLHDMRNRVVHNLPISLGALLYGETIEFPFLPDNPENSNSPYEKKLDPLTESKKWLEGVFDFIDTICADLGKELFYGF